MVNMLWSPVRRWLAARWFPKAVASAQFRQPALHTVRKASRAAHPTARPVTPFRQDKIGASHSPVDSARKEARRFWINLDPQDRRRAAIGGSFAQVCAALESLAAVEGSMKP